jgi:hypothetical protein
LSGLSRRIGAGADLVDPVSPKDDSRVLGRSELVARRAGQPPWSLTRRVNDGTHPGKEPVMGRVVEHHRTFGQIQRQRRTPAGG